MTEFGHPNPEMNIFFQSDSSDNNIVKPDTVEKQGLESASSDLIDEISNATGRNANEVEAALLNLLPERLSTRLDSDETTAGT